MILRQITGVLAFHLKFSYHWMWNPTELSFTYLSTFSLSSSMSSFYLMFLIFFNNKLKVIRFEFYMSNIIIITSVFLFVFIFLFISVVFAVTFIFVLHENIYRWSSDLRTGFKGVNTTIYMPDPELQQLAEIWIYVIGVGWNTLAGVRRPPKNGKDDDF